MANASFYKRIALLPITLILTVLIHVLLLDLLPGNPESWVMATNQYELVSTSHNTFPSVFSHFWSILRLDLGYSYFLGASVSKLVLESLPMTFALTFCCFIGLYPIAIVLSIFLTIKETSWAHVIKRLFMIISSIPSCLIYTFLSVFSYYAWFEVYPFFFAVLFLISRRVASLSSLCVKYIQREKQKRYIKMSYMRNIPLTTIYIHYILKNGLRPIWIRAPKHFFQVLFSGTFMAEVLFSIQGFGRLSFIALKSQDYPLILGCLLTACFAISLAYTAGDIIHLRTYLKRT